MMNNEMTGVTIKEMMGGITDMVLNDEDTP